MSLLFWVKILHQICLGFQLTADRLQQQQSPYLDDLSKEIMSSKARLLAVVIGWVMLRRS